MKSETCCMSLLCVEHDYSSQFNVILSNMLIVLKSALDCLTYPIIGYEWTTNQMSTFVIYYTLYVLPKYPYFTAIQGRIVNDVPWRSLFTKLANQASCNINSIRGKATSMKLYKKTRASDGSRTLLLVSNVGTK